MKWSLFSDENASLLKEVMKQNSIDEDRIEHIKTTINAIKQQLKLDQSPQTNQKTDNTEINNLIQRKIYSHTVLMRQLKENLESALIEREKTKNTTTLHEALSAFYKEPCKNHAFVKTHKESTAFDNNYVLGFVHGSVKTRNKLTFTTISTEYSVSLPVIARKTDTATGGVMLIKQSMLREGRIASLDISHSSPNMWYTPMNEIISSFKMPSVKKQVYSPIKLTFRCT